MQGVQNSCNPVFMEIGEELGAKTFLEYMQKFGFSEKTGVDLAGEATGIIHKLESTGPVELATMSFGQSFQITPLQLLRAASAIVNGGHLITPHFAKGIADENGNIVESFQYEQGEQVISRKTSETMKTIHSWLSYWRKNSNIRKIAKTQWKIYCIFHVFCACRRPAGDGTGTH